MRPAQEGDTVKVHYTGKTGEGDVFDSSHEREPLEFKIGDGSIIPGFEQAVVGMSPGETKTSTIDSEEAYGPYQDEMVQEVERAEMPDNIELEVGQRLKVPRDDQPPLILTVVDLTDSTVKLDANHPLAGKDLTFDIELLDIVE